MSAAIAAVARLSRSWLEREHGLLAHVGVLVLERADQRIDGARIADLPSANAACSRTSGSRP